MTAIDKIISYIQNESWYSLDEQGTAKEILTEAHRLAAEEKSTPDKCQQLCAELREWCNADDPCDPHGGWRDFYNILRKYESKEGK